MNNIAAIILAAGRGTRMNSTDTNKVMSDLNGRPMLAYSIDNLKKAGVETIVVVVGFAKESITSYFGNSILYAYQNEPNGTAHAVTSGLAVLPSNIDTIISVYGDDSYLYDPTLFQVLIGFHTENKSDVTVLTVEMNDPSGLGRIVRDENNNVKAIVEEKVATDEQKKIKEINTGCFIFNRKFLEEYLPQIEMNAITKEYFVTDIIKLAIRDNRKVYAVLSKTPWRGVNRPEELEEARKLLQNT